MLVFCVLLALRGRSSHVSILGDIDPEREVKSC